VDPDRLTGAQRDELLDDIDADLRAAAVAMAGLPRGSQGAVRIAHALFSELSRRLRVTPVERLRTERVRVPGPVKARIVAAEALRRRR
jgi:phytoene/squalene synthetase